MLATDSVLLYAANINAKIILHSLVILVERQMILGYVVGLL
jgi:hypothetical protein